MSTPPSPAVLRLTWARDTAFALMAQHGMTHWQFGFNRNVRRAGVCRYPIPGKPGRIELSAHFVLRNPDAEVIDTILHEIAHALAGPKAGHGPVWKAKCAEVGVRPERCYGEAVVMPKGRWVATCPSCRREHTRHRRPKTLTGWHCKPCGREKGAIRWQLTASRESA